MDCLSYVLKDKATIKAELDRSELQLLISVINNGIGGMRLSAADSAAINKLLDKLCLINSAFDYYPDLNDFKDTTR